MYWHAYAGTQFNNDVCSKQNMWFAASCFIFPSLSELTKILYVLCPLCALVPIVWVGNMIKQKKKKPAPTVYTVTSNMHVSSRNRLCVASVLHWVRSFAESALLSEPIEGTQHWWRRPTFSGRKAMRLSENDRLLRWTKKKRHRDRTEFGRRDD